MNYFLKTITIICTSLMTVISFSQNVGIGLTTPGGKLHIKGSTDAPQLIIDANATQSNINPLINLRKSDGTNLMWIHSDHPFNTFIGLSAGSVNDAAGGGLYNTFMGRSAGSSNTVGYSNTANGSLSLLLNTAGFGNTAFGVSTLQNNSIGNFNTAIGGAALENNTTASENTAIGLKALSLQSYNNNNSTWVSANTAVGHYALYSNQPADVVNGLGNTAIGHSALRSNLTGFFNTSTGYRSLYNNTTGEYNTANGAQALFENTTAGKNTAYGAYALYAQSFSNGGTLWESHNVAIGYAALADNQPSSTSNGKHNTALGSYTLSYFTIALGNTAVGFEALRGSNTLSNNYGSYNTATGYQSLWSNSMGYYNTAIGYRSLNSNSIGDHNTAIGTDALFGNVGGYRNIAIGSFATNDDPNLANNTIIGYSAHIDNASGSVVLGNLSYTNTNNLALLGNTSTAYCGGYVGWTTYISDGRFKKNVQENVSGLAFINQLRPVTYTLDIIGLNKFQGMDEYRKKNSNSLKGHGNASAIQEADLENQFDKSVNQKESILYSGFIAQEVEAAAKKAGYNFSGLKTPQNDQDNYGLTYSDFVVPLVKAVQELSLKTDQQQTIIEEQNKKIELLLKEIQFVKDRLK